MHPIWKIHIVGRVRHVDEILSSCSGTLQSSGATSSAYGPGKEWSAHQQVTALRSLRCDFLIISPDAKLHHN